MKSNDTISVIEKLVFVYENLNILNNEFIREHLDFAIKSIKNMEKEFAAYKQAKSDGRLVVLPCTAGNTVWVLDRDGAPREMIGVTAGFKKSDYMGRQLLCINASGQFMLDSVGQMQR